MKKKLKVGPMERHGYAGTPTYVSYQEMLKRCYNPSVIRYPIYGGRGIKVCDRWRESFLSFLKDMGEKPSRKHSLDRIDNNGDYCPENCRWATNKEQCNNKRNNRYVNAFGKIQTISEWAEETGIPPRIILQRLDRDNFSVEEALTRHNKVNPKPKKEPTLRKRYQSYTAHGRTQTLIEWAKELKLDPKALLNRISSGRFTLDRALSKVSRKSKANS